MDTERLNTWQTLFAKALTIVDSAALTDWTFGGGTVLMLRHRHRFSKDVDIFISDAQHLSRLSPRLNDVVDTLTGDYVEAGNSLKLRFAEGEIDFIASAPLTPNPSVTQSILGRPVHVETSAEIIAKKVWHRGDLFTGRDVFDLAMVAQNEREALAGIEPVLRDRGPVILQRIDTHAGALREAFDELDVLEFDRTFDECIAIVRRVLHQPT